jgi:DNA-binding response OmpR family regulator
MEDTPLKFLIVDDDFVTLSKITGILCEYGICDTATNGPQAISLIENICSLGMSYDLAILDLNLPGSSGWTILRALQVKEEGGLARESKKIIITSEGTKQNVVRAARCKCNCFIVKPIKKKVLIEKIIDLGIDIKGKKLQGQ